MATTRLIVVAVVLVVTASCSGATTTTNDPAAATTTSAQAPATTEASPTTGEPSTTEATTATGPDPAPDLRSLGDRAAVELVDPAPVGLRPTLAWAEVPDAAYYRVVVLDGDGNPYWGWMGTDTSVPFGGAETDTGLTAQVHEPMTWSVAAVDSQGRTIALSDRGSLPGEG